ncbi:MAG: hypothetical protein ACYCZY_01650 [Lacisediminihabitans sp.]
MSTSTFDRLLATLLTIVQRTNNFFDVENYLVRESVGDGGDDTSAPEAAGGAL